MYPLTVWEALEERLTKTASMDPTRNKLLNAVNYFGSEVTMDKQGRISIPPTLRNSATILGEVRVLGSIDRLDIWNEQAFTNRFAANKLTDEDLSQLSALGV
jgi:MraZ protein